MAHHQIESNTNQVNVKPRLCNVVPQLIKKRYFGSVTLDHRQTLLQKETPPPLPPPRAVKETTYGKDADKCSAFVPTTTKSTNTRTLEVAESSKKVSSSVDQEPLSPRLEMRLAMRQSVIYDDHELGPNLTTILGKSIFYILKKVLLIKNKNRARPLFIPSMDGEGYYHESDRTQQSDANYFTREKKNQLILSTRQFKDGHTSSQPKKIKTTYMEQFWICGSR